MLILIIQLFLLLTIGLFFCVHLAGHVLTLLYRVLYTACLPRREFTPEVSIIKPVKGIDRGMKENLASFSRLDYANTFELIFASEPRDAALPVVRDFQSKAKEKNLSVRLVQRPRPPGWMGRASNMRHGVEAAGYEMLMFSDSDVRADPALLKRFLRPLADERTGLVFGWPAYRGCESLGAAFLSMSTNPAILLLAPSALIGFRAPICQYAVGATMAMRKRVLHECGGLEAFAQLATEDVPLARAIARRGYKLHLVKSPVIVINDRASFKGWLEHVVRWLVLVRHHMPLVYGASTPFFIGLPCAILNLLLAWWVRGDLQGALGLFLAVVAVRSLSLWIINVSMVKDDTFLRYLVAAPVHDVLIGFLWLWSWVRNEITWRGDKYRLLHRARAIRLF